MKVLRGTAYRFIRKSESIRSQYIIDRVSVRGELSSRFCVVRLLDNWSSFSRDVILLSALGGCVTGSGRRLPRGAYASLNEAALLARTNSRGKVGNEPRWHDAVVALRVAQTLKPANLGEISAALASVGSPSEMLRLARNHFAHESSQECWDKFAASAWPRGRSRETVWDHLDEVVVAGRSRFNVWIDDLQSIALAATH